MQITELCNVKCDIRLNMRFLDAVAHPLGAALGQVQTHINCNSNHQLCQNLSFCIICVVHYNSEAANQV